MAVKVRQSGQWVEVSGTSTAIPSGGIIMWSGTTAPSGWVLCNDSAEAQAAGAPDLRDRFIVGTGNSYSRDDTGGYTDTFIPEHTHTYSGSVSGGDHSHTYVDQQAHNEGYRPWKAGDNDCGQRSANVGGNGSHTHSYSGTTAVNTGAAAITNAQRSGRNLPPYYALAFIMKI